jgi:hypothetical protein
MAIGTSEPPRIDYKARSSSGELTKEMSVGGETPSATGDIPPAIPFKDLNRKHPDYDADYWRICRALYTGGRQMFRDKKLMEYIFPQHRNEAPDIYKERLKRAFYIPYPGEIIDYIVASLQTDPIELMAESESVDEYYDDFFDDTSPPGGKRLSFQQLLKKQILTALICKKAWTMVDFPRLTDDVAPTTQAQAEAMGVDRAYAIPMEPESIYDWEVDGTGELTWVNVCVETAERKDVLDSRKFITRTYTIYFPDRWARYQITYNREKPPKDEHLVPLVDMGEHSFGKVPLVCLELEDALWAMDKLCGMAMEHFNKRCALSWAEYKSLFQERYEFEGDVNPMAGVPAIAEDEGRAVNQVHGIGYTQLRYANDRVEYVGADPAPFSVALQSLDNLRTEMHRVTHQMALAFDNSASSVGRSGDSKAEDRRAHGVVLVGLGDIVRDHAEDVVGVITTGREEEHEWTASGHAKFDTENLSSRIEDAERMEGISIPSKTFQKRYKYALARKTLGDEASEEDLKLIEDELDEALTDELYTAPAMMAEQVVGDDDDDELDQGEEFVAEPNQNNSNGQSNRRGMSSNPRGF